jgi:hypothetical protein
MQKTHEKVSISQRLKIEFLSTYRLYRDIFHKPSLLFFGTYQVIRDICYELPRSLVHKKIHKNLETHLDESASQALILSEIMTIPGNFIGLFFGKLLTTNIYLASIIGANLGDYIFGVTSYALAYISLTRGHGNSYTIKNALIDDLEVVKDCIPASIILYVSEAPLIALLIHFGMSSEFAVAMNLVIAIIIFL